MKSKLITLLILLIVNCHSYAQSSTDDIFQIDLRKNIDTDKGTFIFYTLKDASSIETIYLNREYYWFANGKIHNSFGGIHGEPLNGQFKHLYLNGSLCESGIFNQGLKHNRWLKWYENGTVLSVYNWQNGELSGMFEEYAPDGKLTKKGMFEQNKLHGKVYYYSNNKLNKIEKYKNGQLSSTKLFKDKTIPKDSTSGHT